MGTFLIILDARVYNGATYTNRGKQVVPESKGAKEYLPRKKMMMRVQKFVPLQHPKSKVGSASEGPQNGETEIYPRVSEW